MITYVKGDLFNDSAEALVNAVNTVGVMGKGLAYQFKNKYPENFDKYRVACKNEGLSIGKVFVVKLEQVSGPKYIFNFPTKAHWRGKSKIEYISEGLNDLVLIVQELGLSSVAIPALGSGLGGLPWSQVEKVMLEALDKVPSVDWHIYAPNEAPPSRSKLKLTTGRSILLLALHAYLRASRKKTLSEQEAQGLVYFLHRKGSLEAIIYDTFRNIPFSSVLHDSLKKMDGHCLYLSGINKAPDATYISLDKEYLSRAKSMISKDDVSFLHIRNTIDLISGYQSNEGMAVISTSLWLSDQYLKEGKERKQSEVVEMALEHLSKQRGISESLIKGALERLSGE